MAMKQLLDLWIESMRGKEMQATLIKYIQYISALFPHQKLMQFFYVLIQFL